jgi:hypothetical protein
VRGLLNVKINNHTSGKPHYLITQFMYNSRLISPMFPWRSCTVSGGAFITFYDIFKLLGYNWRTPDRLTLPVAVRVLPRSRDLSVSRHNCTSSPLCFWMFAKDVARLRCSRKFSIGHLDRCHTAIEHRPRCATPNRSVFSPSAVFSYFGVNSALKIKWREIQYDAGCSS